jgi:Protein of unknown function (DUF2012)
MMKKTIVILGLILVLFTVRSFGQNAKITGTLADPVTHVGVPKTLVILMPAGIDTYTDDNGNFSFDKVPDGSYTLKVVSNTYVLPDQQIDVKGQDIVLGELNLQTDLSKEVTNNDALIPVVSLNDDDAQEGGTGDNNVAGVLTASRDVFVGAASFTFSAARWRARGYNGGEFQVLLNGIPVNELDNGRVQWGNWGGLNDMFRFNDQSYGLEPTTFSFGEIGGSNNIDAVAARQRKQLRISYAGSNRQYNHRVMATYSTGVVKGGWAMSISASYRAATQSYFPGTFMDTWSYFLSVSKKFGDKHVLSFTTFGVPGRRGKNSPSIREAYDITNNMFYNSNWGYQNGRVRNANVNESFQPYFILSHEWKIDKKSSLNTSAAYQVGLSGDSYFNWFNGSNPDPDYYKYLPSYQTDSTLKAEVTEAIQNNPNLLQINWDDMYNQNYANTDSVLNAEGITGNTVVGRRSIHILEKRMKAINEFSFNTYYNNTISDHVAISAGVMYQMQKNRFYKVVDDLLGGDFYVDLNQFAQFTFPGNDSVSQNNYDTPNHIVRAGDEYGYNYELNLHKATVWAQARMNFKKVDFFIAGKLDVNAYWRDGLWRTGLFPNNSQGPSETFVFASPFVKAGLTYKINGRNYVFANGAYGLRAPSVNDVFLSPRTRNQAVENPIQQTVITAEAGFLHNSPKFKFRAVGYLTYTLDGIKTTSFYHDLYNNNVNLTMQNIDVRSFGGEFGLDWKIWKGIALSAAVGIGRSQYIDRPLATTTLDNSQATLAKDETVYFENVNVANGPQWANTIGLSYNSPQFWFVKLNFNYFDWMWVDASPIRRTATAVEGLDPAGDQYNRIITQERLPGAFTMDFFAGYSWKLDKTFKQLKKSHYLNFTASVSNLTNNIFMNGGFEQLRYDDVNKNPDKFPNKYYVAYGINFFLNITYRM